VISWLSGRHWSLHLGASFALGLLTALGFAPYGWWPVAIVAVAGLTLIVAATRRWWLTLAVGYLYGLGLLLLGVGWMQVIFVQAMVALVAIEALFYLLLAALLRFCLRVRWWPLWAASAWTITEFGFSHFPFDGFGWLRLGYAMVDSPLAWGYPVFGVAGVGFLAALIAQTLAWLTGQPSRRRAAAVAGAVASVLGLSAAGLLAVPSESAESVTVGWVQGGAPGGGVYGLGKARDITANHLAETGRLLTRIDAGELPTPDFIVWPENSTDMDPLLDAQTGQMVRAASSRAQLPILVGAILDGPGEDERQTASLWWTSSDGPTQRYIKRGIVPFGEWVPLRNVLVPLIPELAYVGPQSIAGTEPGLLHVTLNDGRSLDLGLMVCYDLTFDNVVADTVVHGGQALVVQSSNAMYQGTGQIDQQFAMTRVRAMELRREILVVTTSGVSGLIRPDGSVAFQTSDHLAASGVVELPLRTNVTIAAAQGGTIELGLIAGGVLGFGISAFWGRMAKSRTESGAQHG
jgi:apolipoprotein N-acyltransferase